MSLENNTIINLYSIIILFIILLHCIKTENKELLYNRIYLLMLKTVMVLLVFDIFSRFDGQKNMLYPLLNQLGNFFIFGLSLLLPSLFLIYVHCQIFTKEEKTRKLYIPLIALNLLNLFFTVLSQFFGFYYSIDQNNIYHRGPGFFIPVLVTFILLFMTFAFIIANKKKFEKKYYYSLLFFAFPPVLSIILQIILLPGLVEMNFLSYWMHQTKKTRNTLLTELRNVLKNIMNQAKRNIKYPLVWVMLFTTIISKWARKNSKSM